MCIRHDDALLSRTDTLQDWIGVGVESNEASGLDVLKLLVTSERADDELRLIVSQHHVSAVVRNQLAEEIEEIFSHCFEAELLGQSDIRIAQDFILPANRLFASQ